MNTKKVIERIKEISPNLGIKGDKKCVFTIEEDKAIDEINDLMVDLFISHKKKPYKKKELELINPLYQGWYGMTIEDDVEEEINNK